MKLIIESDMNELPPEVTLLERLSDKSILVEATPLAANLLKQTTNVRVPGEAQVTPPGQLLASDFDDVENKLLAAKKRRENL